MSIFSLPGVEKINKRIEYYKVGVISVFSEKYREKTFAVILRDTLLKIRPSHLPDLSPEGFDLNCETMCRRCEIVILLENVPVNGFYRVRSVNSTGFVPENDVAAISRGKALSLLNSENMLYITDKFVLTNPSLNPAVSKIPLSFGTKIPIKEKGVNYTVLLPFKGKDGYVYFEEATVGKSSSVHEGPVPFTRKNLLRLSLRMRGMPYDWGESFGGTDCSSLICTAFSLCGVSIPRNSGDIAKISRKSKPVLWGTKSLNSCRPGDILCCRGHVVLYYKKHKGIHYVFHSFYGRGITDITPVTETTSLGKPLYESFCSILPLKFL